MAKRAGHFYYKILRRFMQDSNNGHIHPIFTTFVKKHGLNRPALGKTVVRFLCLHRNVDVALGFIHEFNQNDLKIYFPDDVIKILKEYGRSVDAFKLLMMAKTDLSMVDVVDYSILVDGLCKEGHVEKAVQLCRFARNRGVSLNVVTYNSLFNGLCREGCLVEAFRLFDALEKKNVFPSEITYGTLIDALVRERFLLDARELFERMLVENIKPTTRIYNSLIDGYCKFGKLKEALRLLSVMESDSLKPDEFTVSAVIYGFSLKGNVEGALQFFTNMSENGYRPDFLGYLYLVRGLCTKGRMEEARSVLREMLRVQSVIELINRINVEVEMESVESFLCELCERGSIQEALVVLNEIGAMFFPYKRNTTPQEQIPTVCREEDEICHPVNSSSTSYEMDFDTIYERMASLCFEGDAKGVPSVTKE